MKKGFTLVELLVVVSIIAILSVIGMAVYARAQNSAREIKAKGDLDAFYKAYELKFNVATGKYPDELKASDFVGGIPVPLGGGDYPDCTGGKTGTCNLLGSSTNLDRPFKLCVKLYSGEDWCKESVQISRGTLKTITLADLSSGGGTSPTPTTVAGGGGTGGGGTSPSPTTSASPTASASPATCSPNTSCTFKAFRAAISKLAGETGFNPSCDLRQDGVIDSSDFTCLKNSTTLYGGLQAYWDMEETSGDRLNFDINKTSLKLTVSGASLGIETGPSNMGNAAGNFQSSNAYLTMADQPEVSIIGTKTWAFWMKHSSSGFAIGKVDGSTIEYMVRLSSLGGIIQFIIRTPPTSTCGTTTVSIATDQWNFILAWYDQGTNTVGIQVNNGTAQTVTCTENAAVDRTGAFAVGNSGSLWLNGYIDGLGIWNRLLTDPEKNELFNSGNGKQL